METLKLKVEQTKQTYLANPNEATIKAYTKACNDYEEARKVKKIQEFRKSIEATNEFYKVINSLAPQIVEVMKNYKGNIATTQGSIRKDFLKLLPFSTNIHYYVRTFGSGSFYSENLEFYYNLDNRVKGSYTFYKNSDFIPYELIDFDLEYKVGLEYLNTFLEVSKTLEKCTKPHYLVKEFIKNNNVGLHEIRF